LEARSGHCTAPGGIVNRIGIARQVKGIMFRKSELNYEKGENKHGSI
jgi:hypothetical protein